MTDIITPEMVVDYKSYKWLVSSCFQKSLRRGRFDLAQSYLTFLWEHDRNYITYRLGTILTEDVGIANLELVNTYLDTKLAKKKIDEAGGLEFLLSLTKKACESVKDRSSCDAANLAHYFSFDKHEHISHLVSEQKRYLIDLFHNSHAFYVERIQAGWVLLGNKKFKQDNISFLNTEFYPINEKGEIVDNINFYLEQISLLSHHCSVNNTVEKAYWTQVENMCLGIPIINAAYHDEYQHMPENSKFKVGDCIENIYVKESTIYHQATNLQLITAGIDGHTREGKTAYYQFLSRPNKFSQYLSERHIPIDKHMLILSHCMFRVEGHEVNKRLYFPTAVNVMRDCEQNILNIKLNMPEHSLDFNTIKFILIEEMPNINKIREKIISTLGINMIEKVEPKQKKKNMKS